MVIIMKESRYNIAIKNEDENIVLYNTLTTSLVSLDYEAYNNIFVLGRVPTI